MWGKKKMQSSPQSVNATLVAGKPNLTGKEAQRTFLASHTEPGPI